MAEQHMEVMNAATLNAVQSYLTCSICQDIFRDPRNLPCGHSFCLTCLQEMEVSAKQTPLVTNSEIKCPICRAVYSVKSQSVQTLPKIYAIDHLLQEDRLLTLRRGDKSTSSESGISSGISYCSVHPNLEATLYCAQCVQMGCNTCAGTRHKSHTFFEVGNADVQFTAHLEAMLSSLRAERDSVEMQTKTLQNSISSYGKPVTDATDFFLKRTRNDLFTLFDELVAKFDKYTNETLQKLTRQQRYYATKLKEQVDMRRSAMMDIKQKIEVIEGKLSPSASAADRVAYIESQQLPNAATQCIPTLEEADDAASNVTASHAEVTKWKSDVNEWFGVIADLMSSASSNIPHLEIADLPTTHGAQGWETPPPLEQEDIATPSRAPPSLEPVIVELVSAVTSGAPPAQSLSPMKPETSRTLPHPSFDQPVSSAHRVQDLLRQHKRAPVPPELAVNVALHTGNMVVSELRGNYIDVLSKSISGLLMMGQWNSKSLYVCNSITNSLTSIPLPGNERLFSAAWTHQGNIVCTTESCKVIVMTPSGEKVHTRRLPHPLHISVSADGAIYIADWDSGVYQSADNGATWNLVFDLPFKEWKCVQVVKVAPQLSIGQSQNTTDDFWVLEQRIDNRSKASQSFGKKGRKGKSNSESNDMNSGRLRIYSVDRQRRSGGILPSRNVTPPAGRIVNFQRSRLAYDGQGKIYMTDWNSTAVHVWSVNGDYEQQLLTAENFSWGVNDGPVCLAVDKPTVTGDHGIYVGQPDGIVGVYRLGIMTI